MNTEEMKATLSSDPGNPVFADYAESLRGGAQILPAIEICLRGLTKNPNCHRGRLVLARLYYDAGYIPFAVTELEKLCRYLPESQALRRLLLKLSPEAKIEELKPAEGAANTPTTSATVAETDFSFEDLDLIEEAEKEKKPR